MFGIYSIYLFIYLFIYLPGTVHINQHFSLHINASVVELANELIFIRGPWAGYSKLVPNVINKMLQQVLQNNTVQCIITLHK